jgi:hypothetical protein
MAARLLQPRRRASLAREAPESFLKDGSVPLMGKSTAGPALSFVGPKQIEPLPR